MNYVISIIAPERLEILTDLCEIGRASWRERV